MEELRKNYQWTEKCCDRDTFGAIAGGVAEEYYQGFGNIDADAILEKYLPDELKRLF